MRRRPHALGNIFILLQLPRWFAFATISTGGGNPRWIPQAPDTPYVHPEFSNSNQLHEPSMPGKPVVSEIRSDSVRLTWDAPKSTGGSALSEYRIYKQEYRFAEDDFKSTPGDLYYETLTYETQTFESEHPYRNGVDEIKLIAFPGAANISISFDKRTDVEAGHDWLQFLPNTANPPRQSSSPISDPSYDKNSPFTSKCGAALDGAGRTGTLCSEDLPSVYLSGRAQTDILPNDHDSDSTIFPWPGTVVSAKPFVVQSDRLLFRWFTDDSVGRATTFSLADDHPEANNGTEIVNDNTLYGFRFTATAAFISTKPAFVGNFEPVYSDVGTHGKSDWPAKYTSQVVTGLRRATSYRFIVAARNTFLPSERQGHSTRTGAWSPLSVESDRITTLATVPLPPVHAPEVSPGSVEATKVKLSWFGSSDNGGASILGYVLQRRNTTCVVVDALPSCKSHPFLDDPNEGLFIPVAPNSGHTSSSVITYEIHGMAANTSYQFRVAAVNSIGAGPQGPASIEIATLSATVPDPPTQLRADMATFSSIKMSWRAPSDTKGYPVLHYNLQRTKGAVLFDPMADANNGAVTKERDAAAAAVFDLGIEIHPLTTSHTFSGLMSGYTYMFRISAVSIAGQSTYSNTVVAVTASTPTVAGVAPRAPENVVVAVHGNSANHETQLGLSVNWQDYTSQRVPVSHYILMFRERAKIESPLDSSLIGSLNRSGNGYQQDAGPWQNWGEQLADRTYNYFIPANHGYNFDHITKIGLASDQNGEKIEFQYPSAEAYLSQFEFVVSGRNAAGYGPFSSPPASYNSSDYHLVTHYGTATGKTVSKMGSAEANGAQGVFVDDQLGGFSSLRNLTIGGTTADLARAVGSTIEGDANAGADYASNNEEIVIVNSQHDDSTSDDCLAKSGRQTLSAIYHDEGFGSNIKIIVISFGEKPFDVPPDIERIEAADEDPTLRRSFEFTVQTIWMDKFALKIRRTDLNQGWSRVLKILWRAAAPAEYKCSVRGALKMQSHLPDGWKLRVVLQTMNANVTGPAIDIYRNVTIETDPRLGVVDLTILSLISQPHGSHKDNGLPISANVSGVPTAAAHLATTVAPARATIGGGGITVEGMCT